MGKDVIIRGETYNGVGKVNLLTANGSANFYDVSGALCTITAEYDEVEEYDEVYTSDKTAQEVYDALAVGINPVFRFHNLLDTDAYIYASLTKLESTEDGEELTLSSFQTDAMIADTLSDYFTLTVHGEPPAEGTTVSDTMVHVTDALAAPAVALLTEINYVQSGTGDPSPDNIRPINGWTGVNIRRTGANIWGGDTLAEAFRGATGFSKSEATKTITFQRTSTSPYHHTLCKLPFRENTRYTIIFRYSNSGNNNSIKVAYSNGTYDSYSLTNSNGEKASAYVVTRADRTLTELWIGYTDIALTTIYYEESGIIEGVLTDEDFEAYSAENYRFAFRGSVNAFAPDQFAGYPSPTNVYAITPGLTFARDDSTTLTVYGGTFEINADGTGTITETLAGRHASDLTWTQNSSNNHTFNGEGFTDRMLRIDANARNDCFCDSYRWYTSSTVASQSSGAALANASSGTLAARSRIYLSDDRFNGVAAFAASFSTYDPLFVLPLETPVTYNLSATEVIRVCTALGLVYVSSETVFGGELDATSGTLTVTHGEIASYAGETLPGEWISDRDVYAAGTTPTTGAQVVYELATPQTYTLTPTEVTLLLGTNNVWSDTGDTTLTYLADGRVNSLTALNMLLGGMYEPSSDVTDKEALSIIMGETE